MAVIQSVTATPPWVRDRKSTRLNSSHRCISYAVFCLKKKKKTHERARNVHARRVRAVLAVSCRNLLVTLRELHESQYDFAIARTNPRADRRRSRAAIR